MSKRWTMGVVGLVAAVGMVAAVACGPTGGDEPGSGGLHTIAQALDPDIVGVLYEITCEDGTTLSEFVPFEAEGLPPHVDAGLAGEPFADWFAVLPAVECVVTATAMTDPDTPAEGCEPVSETVTIEAGQTTELLLVIVCDPDPVGALDVITVVVDGPSIGDLGFDPSKFVVQCEELTLTATGTGGTGPLSYTWTVITTPPGAVYTATPAGAQLLFWAETPGMYEVTVTVSDGVGSTSLTFPIHVSDDPDVEHCYEVCCQLDDGHAFYGSLEACEDAGGAAVAEEVCEAMVCCETAAGPAIVQAIDCPLGALLAEDACVVADEVCCVIDGTDLVWLPSASACAAIGGVVTDDDKCAALVCCNMGGTPQIVDQATCPPGQVLPMDKCHDVEVCCEADGAFQIVPMSACTLPQVVPMDQCASLEVCCEVDGLPYVMTLAACEAAAGVVVSDELCVKQTCCKLPDGSFEILVEETCKAVGGVAVAAEQCKNICCQIEGFAPIFMLLGNCEAAAGVVLAPEACVEVATHVWHADYTLDPTQECELEPYLVVPSSGANQLAVYRTDTLEPLPTTPFDTCGNPSRILMDANTDVYAACRNDGQVYKHTRDGVVLWVQQLPGCAGSRGVVLSGDGRLFAGCSDPGYGMVFELDPVTGIVLDAVDAGWRVYGLAASATGLFVADYYEHHVVKIGLGGATDMTVLWTSDEVAYGICVDPAGDVWIGGSTYLRRLSPVDGTVLTGVSTAPTGNTAPIAMLYGVMAGLDGRIYGATMSGYFVRYDPVAGTMDHVALDPGAAGNRGLTLDADDNVYSINMNSNSLTRTTAAGVSTGFGDAAGTVFLVNPYGYSGDMTGLMSACMSGTTDVWVSSVLDSGSPTTTWLTLSWIATTPPGSSVNVFYSADGGATWTMATNGQVLGVVAQTLQVKAHLASTIPGNEPTLSDITVTYQ